MVARNKLTDKKIKALDTGTHGDGAGLYIRINHRHSKQWIYRFNYLKKPKTMGLGSYPDVSLKEARQLRDQWAAVLISGKNPIEVNNQQKLVLERGSDNKKLSYIVYRAFEARKASLKEKGQKGEWVAALKNHVLPSLGDKNVETLTQHDVYQVFKPIWKSKAPTAKKAINRLKISLEYAESFGLEVNVDIIRRAKNLLGAQPKNDNHLPYMVWQDVPEFYRSLTNKNHTHLGLRFLILNPGPRTKPILKIRLEQIEDDIWRIPAPDMKASKPFLVPLSDESLKIIEELKPFERDGNLFAGRGEASLVSENIFSEYMRVKRGLGVVPHGFRSSFRTWAFENGYDHYIAELCISHKVFSDVEAAYIRSDAFVRRRDLALKWSDYVCGGLL